MNDASPDSPIASLGPENEGELHVAWPSEIDRRVAQIDSGAVELIPWSDARPMLWNRLKR